jgi:hypothetical protein
MNVTKLISRGMTYEIGDFYKGDGENDVIRKMEIVNHLLFITTDHNHIVPVQFGDWAKFEDGTSMTFDAPEESNDGH